MEERRQADVERQGPLISVIMATTPDHHYLTSGEREELHRLKLALPCTTQLKIEAKARIKARIAARKLKRGTHALTNKKGTSGFF